MKTKRMMMIQNWKKRRRLQKTKDFEQRYQTFLQFSCGTSTSRLHHELKKRRRKKVNRGRESEEAEEEEIEFILLSSFIFSSSVTRNVLFE
jgi:hypothetical protein